MMTPIAECCIYPCNTGLELLKKRNSNAEVTGPGGIVDMESGSSASLLSEKPEKELVLSVFGICVIVFLFDSAYSHPKQAKFIVKYKNPITPR